MKTRWFEHEVAYLQMDVLEPGATQSYDNVGLYVPPVPASFLVGCTIIDLAYELKVNCHFMQYTTRIVSDISTLIYLIV